MSNMDEISYWIHTKRAPCLYKYDNVIKRQYEKLQNFSRKPSSEPSEADKLSSPVKKKKRKISILDDSGSTEQQQNVYFETSQQHNKTVLSSCKSEGVGSDVDFNIKNSSIRAKPKRLKVQRNNVSTLHKNNKLITSTPKPAANLRRSLRRTRKCINTEQNNTFNSSFEEFAVQIVNDHNRNETTPKKFDIKKRSIAKLNEYNDDKKKCQGVGDTRTNHINGQFDDMSDVSGFTANYIRSTKIHAGKNCKTRRNKTSRNLIKYSQQNNFKDNRAMTVCVNKSTTCPPPPMINSSMDSSQNVINLITYEKDGKTSKVDKSTSLLKFIDSKLDKVNNRKGKHKPRQSVDAELNRQSQHEVLSRYPKRCKKTTADITNDSSKTNDISHSYRGRTCIRNSGKNDSDRKENPEELSVSRTRSGRSIGLSLRQPENTLLVLSNSTEQVSSAVTMNVATPDQKPSRGRRKAAASTKCMRNKKTVNKSNEEVKRDSLRDKSGFAACFSDSDDDKPLKTQKFFC